MEIVYKTEGQLRKKSATNEKRKLILIFFGLAKIFKGKI
jgi:hypothetical protein